MASGPNQAAAQLRELGDSELATKLRESKEELFNLRFQSATGQLQSNHRLRSVRTDIARIYTVLRERELGIASAPAEQPTATPAKARKATKTTSGEKAEPTGDKARTGKADTGKAIEKDEVNA